MTTATTPLRNASTDAWWFHGRCAETDPEAFFPEKGGTPEPAKRVCARCEVRAECLAYALTHDERYGIWGGMTEHERRRLRRSRGQAPATPPDLGEVA